jgi:hypothetical protein
MLLLTVQTKSAQMSLRLTVHLGNKWLCLCQTDFCTMLHCCISAPFSPDYVAGDAGGV